jgi:hypothetical protein
MRSVRAGERRALANWTSYFLSSALESTSVGSLRRARILGIPDFRWGVSDDLKSESLSVAAQAAFGRSDEIEAARPGGGGGNE